jgi:hypothetical protein
MYKRLKLCLAILMIFSPLGLVAEGTAWGEWSAEEIQNTFGYVPEGMARFSDWWQALFPDYTLSVFGGSSLGHSAGYIISALIGSIIIYGVAVLLARVLLRQTQIGPNK